MSNENHKLMADEIYQYPEEEYVAHHPEKDSVLAEHLTAPETVEKPGYKQVLEKIVELIKKNRRVSMVIGIVILVLLGLKLFGKHESAAKPAAAQPSIAQSSFSVHHPLLSKSADYFTSSQLNHLRQSTEQSQSEFNQLQGQVNDLRTTLNQTQTQMAQTIIALANEVKQLSTQVAAQSASNRGGANAAIPLAQYHVKAIMPGRAWIESGDGLSLSVTAGDKVPDYGQVLSVNENEGLITTSSGRTIHYGSNDR